MSNSVGARVVIPSSVDVVGLRFWLQKRSKFLYGYNRQQSPVINEKDKIPGIDTYQSGRKIADQGTWKSGLDKHINELYMYLTTFYNKIIDGFGIISMTSKKFRYKSSTGEKEKLYEIAAYEIPMYYDVLDTVVLTGKKGDKELKKILGKIPYLHPHHLLVLLGQNASRIDRLGEQFISKTLTANEKRRSKGIESRNRRRYLIEVESISDSGSDGYVQMVSKNHSTPEYIWRMKFTKYSGNGGKWDLSSCIPKSRAVFIAERLVVRLATLQGWNKELNLKAGGYNDKRKKRLENDNRNDNIRYNKVYRALVKYLGDDRLVDQFARKVFQEFQKERKVSRTNSQLTGNIVVNNTDAYDGRSKNNSLQVSSLKSQDINYMLKNNNEVTQSKKPKKKRVSQKKKITDQIEKIVKSRLRSQVKRRKTADKSIANQPILNKRTRRKS